MTASMLEHALKYAYDGWPVFPCKVDKRPFTRHGCKDATTEPAQIRAWWKTWPQAGIGLATGAKAGIWVLDIDPGAGGTVSLKVLELEHGPLPDTLRVRTGGGGWHYYFKWPTDRVVKNRSGMEPGLDVRGEGGYVILPPSAHESGHAYTWELEGVDIDVADAWLLEKACPRATPLLDEPTTKVERAPIRNPKAYAEATIAKATESVRSALEGDRNGTLNRVAFSLRDLIFAGYISRSSVETHLQTAGEACGLTADETRKTIASGLGDAQGPVDATPKVGPEDPTVLASAAPMRVAEHMADTYRDAQGRLLVRRWRGEWYRYRQGCYRPFDGEDLEAETWRALDRLWVPGKDGPQPFTPSIAKVANVTRALIACEGVAIDATAEPPIWVGGDVEDVPRDVLVCRNGVLDLATEKLRPLTPDLFSTSVVETPWVASPGTPKAWTRFLESLWPEDPDARNLLQEWFGYCLTNDTSQQKMLFVVGPKRSGKGTIARILSAMLGRDNVAGPSLSGLATPFGLQSLIGRPVGIISDARLSGRSDQAVIIERLLSITGEDAITVDRKHKDPVTLRLITRLIILSNELPRLSDASGALASRMLLLQLARSFYGAENTELEGQLLEELPAILVWAVKGWQRLRERGRFLVPESSQEAVDDLDALCSPVQEFVSDVCDTEPGDYIDRSLLWSEWKAWCATYGHEPGSVGTFIQRLKAAQPGVHERRPKKDVPGNRPRQLVGITTNNFKKMSLNGEGPGDRPRRVHDLS